MGYTSYKTNPANSEPVLYNSLTNEPINLWINDLVVADENGFDETSYVNEVAAADFFGYYENQIVTVASACGAAAFVLLVVGLIATVVIVKHRKNKKQAVKVMATSHIKEYVV
jgi:hypothetical protein